MAVGNRAEPALVVVMGISGVGKTAVGEALAARLGVPYADGDDFHSEANVAKMSAGIALTDEDRWPWLRDVGRWLADHEESGGVVSCSALRRVYRDLLLEEAPDAQFLHLTGSHDLILDRMEHREHYMPPALLESQEQTLEPLAADEPGTAVDVTPSVEQIVDAFLASRSGSTTPTGSTTQTGTAS